MIRTVNRQREAMDGTCDRAPAVLAAPEWLTTGPPKTPEKAAFQAGAAFAMLDMALGSRPHASQGDPASQVPYDLLANTLALQAAAATSKLEGRLTSAADIRDAWRLTPPDADGVRHWGPDGDGLAFWRRAVKLRLVTGDWQAKLAALAGPRFEDEVTAWVDEASAAARRDGPMAAAVGVMKMVLFADDRAERIACLLADVVLAKALRWERPLPLSALHLQRSMLRDLQGQRNLRPGRRLRDLRGPDDGDRQQDRTPEIAIIAALIDSARSAYGLAVNLADRARALRAIAPKLRARSSDDAVALFLTEDAVSPSGMLSPVIRGTRTPMTGRAARRLCDRLVELGVVRELTGRSTFRLYGL